MKTRWVLLNLTSHFQSLVSIIRHKFDSQGSTFLLNHVDVSRLLPRCAGEGLSHFGASVHASIVKASEFHDPDDPYTTPDVLVVWNSLLCLYSKHGGALSDAVKLFDEMPVRDTVSWNTLISGFLRNGLLDIGFGYFKRMREVGFHHIDHATLTTVLSGLEKPEFLNLTKMVHCLVFRSGYGEEITVGNSLITSYFKCGSTSSGTQVFDEKLERNVITWTAMISGLVENESYVESLNFFVIMRRNETVTPNFLTYLSTLVACSGLQELTLGCQIHALLLKLGLESGLRVESALMDMYSKSGSIKDMCRVFESVGEPDEVSMTVVLAGFSQNGLEDEAVRIFKKMISSGMEIDSDAVSSALGVFGNESSLGLGRQIHAMVVKWNFGGSTYVNNRLVNMYSKCGDLEGSVKVFDEMPRRNSVSWNSMVAGLARHGDAHGAIELYQKMKIGGVDPTDVTFLSLIHACGHAGLVEKGMELFDSMVKDHGMSPRDEHYGCVVDMLGRAGLLSEAKDFIVGLSQKPGPLVWQALLGVSSLHSDSELGKFAAEQLALADPVSPASYVLMAKIYSSEGKWKERARTIKKMKDTGVPKETGVSWIEIEKKVHSFIVSDRVHPRAEAIYGILDTLSIHDC